MFCTSGIYVSLNKYCIQVDNQQVSYNQCIRCILYGEVMERFRQNLPNFELPDQLMPFYQSDQKVSSY